MRSVHYEIDSIRHNVPFTTDWLRVDRELWDSGEDDPVRSGDAEPRGDLQSPDFIVEWNW